MSSVSLFGCGLTAVSNNSDVTIMDSAFNKIQSIVFSSNVNGMAWCRASRILACSVNQQVLLFETNVNQRNENKDEKTNSIKIVYDDEGRILVEVPCGIVSYSSSFALGFQATAMEWCLATIFVAGKGILASWKVDFKLVKMIPESQKSVESFFNVCKSSNVHLPEFGCKWSITGFDFPIQKIAACITSKGLFISTASCNEDTSVKILDLPPVILYNQVPVVQMQWAPLLSEYERFFRTFSIHSDESVFKFSSSCLLTLDISGVCRIWRQNQNTVSSDVFLYSYSGLYETSNLGTSFQAFCLFDSREKEWIKSFFSIAPDLEKLFKQNSQPVKSVGKFSNNRSFKKDLAVNQFNNNTNDFAEDLKKQVSDYTRTEWIITSDLADVHGNKDRNLIAVSWLDSFSMSRVVNKNTKGWLLTLDIHGALVVWMVQHLYSFPRCSVIASEFLTIPNCVSLPPYVSENRYIFYRYLNTLTEFYTPYSYSQSSQYFTDIELSILTSYNKCSSSDSVAFGSILHDPNGVATPHILKLLAVGALEFPSHSIYEIRFSNRTSQLISTIAEPPCVVDETRNFKVVVTHSSIDIPLVASLSNGAVCIWTYSTPLNFQHNISRRLHFLQSLSGLNCSYIHICWHPTQPWLFCLRNQRNKIPIPGFNGDIDVFSNSTINAKTILNEEENDVIIDIFCMGTSFNYQQDAPGVVPLQSLCSLDSPCDPYVSNYWSKVASLPFGPNSPWDVESLESPPDSDYFSPIIDFFILEWDIARPPVNESNVLNSGILKRNLALTELERDGITMLLVLCRVAGVRTYSFNSASLIPTLFHSIRPPNMENRVDLFPWVPLNSVLTSVAVYRLPIGVTPLRSAFQIWIATLDGKLYQYSVIEKEVECRCVISAAMGASLSNFTPQNSLFHTGTPSVSISLTEVSERDDEFYNSFPVYSGRFISSIHVDTFLRVRISLSPILVLPCSIVKFLNSKFSSSISLNESIKASYDIIRPFQPLPFEICVWECMTTGQYFDFSLETSIPVYFTPNNMPIIANSLVLSDDNSRIVTIVSIREPHLPDVTKLMLYAPRLHVNRSSWRARDISRFIPADKLASVSSVTFTPSCDLIVVGSSIWVIEREKLFSVDKKTDINPLPSYHPTELIQYLLRGNQLRVKLIIRHLLNEIQNKPDEVSFLPPVSLNDLACTDNSAIGDFDVVSSIDSLSQNLQHKNLHLLSRTNTLRLLAVISSMQHICVNSRDLDYSGSNFLLQFRLFIFLRRVNVLPQSSRLSSSELLWAFHSDMQESLITLCLPSGSSNKTTQMETSSFEVNEILQWKHFNILGLPLWLKNPVELRKLVEKLAKNQYSKNHDARESMLLYLILGRKNVVQGLMKVANDNESKKIFTFLSRDFNLPENKSAAIKNACVLASQKKYEMSMSFFLLAGAVSDAILICTRNLNDNYLALLIARLFGGEDSEIYQTTLRDELLPEAIAKRDRWMQHMILWQLGKIDEAVQVLLNNKMRSANAPLILSALLCFENHPRIGRYFICDGEERRLLLRRAACAYLRSGSPWLALECIHMVRVSVMEEIKTLETVLQDLKVNNKSLYNKRFALLNSAAKRNASSLISISCFEIAACTSLICARQSSSLDEPYIRNCFKNMCGPFRDMMFLQKHFSVDFIHFNDFSTHNPVYELIKSLLTYTIQLSSLSCHITQTNLIANFALNVTDSTLSYDSAVCLNHDVKLKFLGISVASWLKILNSHVSGLSGIVSQLGLFEPFSDSSVYLSSSFDISPSKLENLVNSFMIINEIRMTLLCINEECGDKLILSLELANSPLCFAFLQTCLLVVALNSRKWSSLDAVLKGSESILQASISSSTDCPRYSTLLKFALEFSASINMMKFFENSRDDCNSNETMLFGTKSGIQNSFSLALLLFVEELVIYLSLQRWILDFRATYVPSYSTSDAGLYPALSSLYAALTLYLEKIAVNLLNRAARCIRLCYEEVKLHGAILSNVVSIFLNPVISPESAAISCRLPAYSSVLSLFELTCAKRLLLRFEEDITKFVHQFVTDDTHLAPVDIFKCSDPTLAIAVDPEGKCFAVGTITGIRESSLESALTFRKRIISRNNHFASNLVDTDMNEWEGCLHQFDQLAQSAMWQNLSDGTDLLYHAISVTLQTPPLDSSLFDTSESVVCEQTAASSPLVYSHQSNNWLNQLSFLDSHVYGVPLSRVFYAIMRPPINSSRRCQPLITNMIPFSNSLHSSLTSGRPERLRRVDRSDKKEPCLVLAMHHILPFYVSCSSSGTILLWHFGFPHPMRELQNVSALLKRVTRMILFNNRLLVAGNNGSFAAFIISPIMSDFAAPYCIIKAHSKCCNDIGFLHGGNRVVSVGDSFDKRDFCVWDTSISGELYLSFALELYPDCSGDGGSTALAVLPDSCNIIVGSSSGGLSVINVDLKSVGSVQKEAHSSSISHIVISTTSKHQMIITGDSEGTIKSWKLENCCLKPLSKFENVFTKQRFFRLSMSIGLMDTIGLSDLKITSFGHIICTGSDGTVKILLAKD